MVTEPAGADSRASITRRSSPSSGDLAGPERSFEGLAELERLGRGAGSHRSWILVHRYPADMGFDPERRHRRTNFDYWYVGAAIVVCAVLVVWAFFG